MQGRATTVVLHLQQKILGHAANHREGPFPQYQRHHPLPLRRRLLNVPPHGAIGEGHPGHAGYGGQQVGEADGFFDHSGLQHPRGMDQQRYVVAFQPQLFKRGGHVGDLADAGVVVAEEHENRVVVVAARFGDLHQPADVEVQQAHGVVLLQAAGTGGLDLFQGQVLGLEAVVVPGDGERAVVAGGLQVGEERLVLGDGAQ